MAGTMMAGTIEVHVMIAGRTRRAGTLYAHRRRGVESATFVYDNAYLADPDAYALDPGLPLAAGQHQTRVGQPLFSAFTDTAPDRWGRALIAQAERRRQRDHEAAIRSLGETDYLIGVRDDLRQGALRFRFEDQGPFLAEPDAGVPALSQLGELLGIADRAEQDAATYEELARLVRAGSSLGGARPKAHVVDVDGEVAIAKFPSAAADEWDVMAWEKVAHDLADASGVDVPASKLVHIGDRSVHVIDRFDRDGETRLGYVSAMTMLEASDGDQRSYLEIAEVIEECSPAATYDLHRLWRRIVFSVLTSNTDDHLRNHGFLHVAGDQWTLSPAFDLNPDPTPGPKHLSTLIDEAETAATVDNVLAVADFFRLTDAEAEQTLAEVVGAVRTWRDMASRHGVSAREIEVMAPAFAQAEATASRP